VSRTSITRHDGFVIDACVVYECTGQRPRGDFLSPDTALGAARSGPQGGVVVDDFLRVEGFENVFAAGDLCSHGTREVKLIDAAERNAACVARNVLRLSRAKAAGVAPPPLATYSTRSSPTTFCLALGPRDGALCVGGRTVLGPAAAVAKAVLRWARVARAAGRPAGDFLAGAAAAALAVGRRFL